MTSLWLAAGNALVMCQPNLQHSPIHLHLQGLPVQCVAIDPLNPQQIYCGTLGEGLWRSQDGGEHWQPAEEGISTRRIYSVAVSQTERIDQRGVVYAGTEPSGLFRSEDCGETWQECQRLTELPSASEWSFPPRPDTHHVRWILPDPHQTSRLFVAIEAGALITSNDAGLHWQDRIASAPIDTHQLVSPLPDWLYSAAGDGYFESRDGGQSWQKPEAGLEHRYVWSIAVDAGDAENIILSTAAGPRESHALSQAESFLYRRTLQSEWQKLTEGLPPSSGRRTAVLAAHPLEAGTFYAAWEQEIYHSRDAGASWQALPLNWPKEYKVKEPCALALSEKYS